MMRGLPYIARLGYGLLTPKNSVAGMDVAGKVEGIGKGVRRFQPPPASLSPPSPPCRLSETRDGYSRVTGS